MRVQTISDLFMIPAEQRQVGQTVFVVEQEMDYQLKRGIKNEDWKPLVEGLGNDWVVIDGYLVQKRDKSSLTKILPGDIAQKYDGQFYRIYECTGIPFEENRTQISIDTLNR